LSRQHTIRQPVECSGAGLFFGEPVSVRFHPAPANHGLVFFRADQRENQRLPATLENVTKRNRRTSLRNGTWAVETVEHCLAAANGLGIDNLLIEINANELPAGDGSSMCFVEALRSAGLEEQSAPRRPWMINEMVRVHDAEGELLAVPPVPHRADHLEIQYELDYGADSAVGRQLFVFRLDPQHFIEQIAPARTFVLEAEARQFQAMGLGKHLTYRDILVYGPQGVIDNELKFTDEPVRHKILDLIGDLALLGRPIYGRIFARRSGHALNHEMVRRFREAIAAADLGQRLTAEPKGDIRHIQRILPHRYPFLLVDRVIELEGTRRAVGVKNVSINEPYFQGHYPGQPIMPGVLIIEAMAQLGGVLLSQELEHKGKVAVLLSLDRVKFRRAVAPGDQLVLEAEVIRVKSRTGHVRCTARVGESLAAEAMIKFMMVDADPV
jgi:UDP-3-O-[3-hydroxymyristoyl] N-acetylglucosamine deacetylase/3-hydroxyacyl-[acyl-carrier-protein] dehydratase